MFQSLRSYINNRINDVRESIQNLRRYFESAVLARFYNPTVPRSNSLCKFLKTKTEVYHCTHYLRKNGYISHRLHCKDWDIANIVADLSDGNLLDMGSWDSYILRNAIIKGVRGEKYGIDLQKPDVPVPGVQYVVGDLLKAPFPDGFFQNVTCLSVIEHEVDFKQFASEASRLLSQNGKLYLTFDYWTPKITTDFKLFGKKWNLLDKNDVVNLVQTLKSSGLHISQDIDWSLGQQVVNDKYYSPVSGIGYTFGLLVFEKKITGKKNE